MRISQSDIDAALELFSGLGELTTRKMMGGVSIYRNGTIFAIIPPDDVLMLKCQGRMVPRVEDMGGTRWVYTRKDGRQAAMPYWRMPDAALDDPDLACELARDCLELLESP